MEKPDPRLEIVPTEKTPEISRVPDITIINGELDRMNEEDDAEKKRQERINEIIRRKGV